MTLEQAETLRTGDQVTVRFFLASSGLVSTAGTVSKVVRLHGKLDWLEVAGQDGKMTLRLYQDDLMNLDLDVTPPAARIPGKAWDPEHRVLRSPEDVRKLRVLQNEAEEARIKWEALRDAQVPLEVAQAALNQYRDLERKWRRAGIADEIARGWRDAGTEAEEWW